MEIRDNTDLSLGQAVGKLVEHTIDKKEIDSLLLKRIHRAMPEPFNDWDDHAEVNLRGLLRTLITGLD